jgi:hypothetical protein
MKLSWSHVLDREFNRLVYVDFGFFFVFLIDFVIEINPNIIYIIMLNVFSFSMFKVKLI